MGRGVFRHGHLLRATRSGDLDELPGEPISTHTNRLCTIASPHPESIGLLELKEQLASILVRLVNRAELPQSLAACNIRNESENPNVTPAPILELVHDLPFQEEHLQEVGPRRRQRRWQLRRLTILRVESESSRERNAGCGTV